MNEATKTLIYVAVAAGVAVTAFATRPVSPSLDPNDDVGEPFFADFTDPSSATSLEILEFDEQTGEVNPFKVEVVDGVWTIPSHFNYPADSENRLGEVAASVIGLEKMGIASDIPGDHELFGVLDPRGAESGAVGVGMRLTLLGPKGGKLVDLIIGKEIKGQTGVRYVRLPEQNRVYTTAFDPKQWTTKFADWIEDDLLKLNSFDVASIHIDDYSVDVLNGRINYKSQIDLTHDDSAETKWTLADLVEGEELDTTKLDAMTRALDELKIVDVRRKPAGLSGTLRASAEEGLAVTMDARQSLQDKGFYISEGSLLSNKGQVVCMMKDGVEYVLRFGDIAVGTEKSDSGDDEADAGESDQGDTDVGDENKPAEGENRYLFVMAQFNETLLEQPELTPLPGSELPGGQVPAAPAAGETPTEEPATAEPTSDEAGTKEADEDVSAAESFDDSQLLALAQAEDAPTADVAAPATEPASAAEPANAIEPASATEPAPVDAIAAEEARAEIEAENKRLVDEFNAKVEEGKKRVNELNDRFADWYYVISNEVYEKIHLSRENVIKQPEPAAGDTAGPNTGAAANVPQGDTIDAFEALKNQVPGQ
jgi:hypothetical protein